MALLCRASPGASCFFLPLRQSEIYGQSLKIRLKPAVVNAGGGEHALRGARAVRCRVLVREVDDLLDAALDDRLAALVAREERRVEAAALQGRARVDEGV